MTYRLEPGSSEYRRLFDSFTRSAFRLETFQRYQVDYEEEPLRRFLAGEPRPHDPHKQGWIERVRNAAAAGKTMRRVHIVVEPVSDYLRYELSWSYRDNVAAGEDIGIIATDTGRWPADLPRHDYWLFDDQVLLRMIYDADTRLVEAELIDDPAEVGDAVRWRDVALATAVPYRDYMSRHQGLLNRVS
ncbi:hypothetical protein GCM10023191_102300 [Actinoallomurus oryzae]|uniref:DUF6879 domain-containing protein n=1 Tax=Actinoallomurus oryzae TaxID=502180 RepID=A0ABP8R9K5_9ACTN